MDPIVTQVLLNNQSATITDQGIRLAGEIAAKNEADQQAAAARVKAASMAGLAERSDRLLREARSENQSLQQSLSEKDALLAQKNALILEWMHSNEAFKQLARKYGKQLGVSDAQRDSDFQEQILDVAEEDPKFKDTKLAAKVKAAKSAPPKP